MFTLRCLVDDNSLDVARYRAEHGVSFLIETSAGRVLLDTGQSGDALLHNAAQAGIDLCRVDALVLSHAHQDHTGGLEAFLQKIRPGLPVYAHPDVFRERYAMKDGQARSVGLRLAQSELEKRVHLHLSAEPERVLPGVWTTGEITPRTEFEGRSPNHLIRAENGWQPDPYRDDISLVVDAPPGLFLVCGCCHAGLLNTLAHVRRTFDKKVVAIAGGTHLGGLDTATLEYAIAGLRALDADGSLHLYLNHCTGKHALEALAHAFGERAHPFPAGALLQFD